MIEFELGVLGPPENPEKNSDFKVPRNSMTDFFDKGMKVG